MEVGAKFVLGFGIAVTMYVVLTAVGIITALTVVRDLHIKRGV